MYMLGPQRVDIEHNEPKYSLGQMCMFPDGRVYQYVKANEALAIGDALTPMISLHTGDCDANSGKAFAEAAATFTEETCLHSYIKIIAGTIAKDQLPNRIVEFVSSILLKVETDWADTLTTSEDYVIYNENFVEKIDAAAEMLAGVCAHIAITINYHFWMQVRGYCPQVKFIGSANPSVAHEGLIASSTVGTLMGLTGTTTADEAEKSNAKALIVSALTQLVPCILNCR